MPSMSRIGDMGVGVCPCHDSPVSYVTTFVTGANTVFTNGANQTYIGTIGVASCGHPTFALTGSPDVYAEGSPVHRVGDMGENCGPYTAITGSDNVAANGA